MELDVAIETEQEKNVLALGARDERTDQSDRRMSVKRDSVGSDSYHDTQEEMYGSLATITRQRPRRPIQFDVSTSPLCT